MAEVQERVLAHAGVELWVAYDDTDATYLDGELISGGKLTGAEWINPAAAAMRILIAHYPGWRMDSSVVFDETTTVTSRKLNEPQIRNHFRSLGFSAPPPRSRLGFSLQVL